MLGLELQGKAHSLFRARRQVDQLRVLAHVFGYPPKTTSGGERSLEAILSFLAREGHEVLVLASPSGAEQGLYDGVCVRHERGLGATLRHYVWADVVISQMNYASRAGRLSCAVGVPMVQLLRRGGTDPSRRYGLPAAVVYNTDWLRQADSHSSRVPCLVVHPPVFPEAYATNPGSAVGLINFSEFKGANTLVALARALPEIRFLGVRGGWGEQVSVTNPPPNLEVIDGPADMRDVYSRLRILLVPSRYETYGRVGVEAAASGIPTIAHPSPGVLEALGRDARYADRDDIGAWIAHIRDLAQPQVYAQAAAAARRRSHELHPLRELQALESLVLAVSKRNLPVTGVIRS